VSWQAPNLARRPFLNLRPVRRVAAVLAVAAVALTSWNVASYVRAGSGAAERAAELARLATETTAARERLATLEADLAGHDLAAENGSRALPQRPHRRAHVRLERPARSARRGAARGVRLRSLAPRFTASAAATDRRRVIALVLDAEASDGESMLELIDNLFAHPSFASPNLSRENRQRGGDITFDLTVDYFPEAQP
jgi:hypothetical protein